MCERGLGQDFLASVPQDVLANQDWLTTQHPNFRNFVSFLLFKILNNKNLDSSGIVEFWCA